MAYTPKNQFGNNSVGFVYFDNSGNNSTGLSESFDYIEFSNTNSPNKGFSPSVCSSPQQFRQRNNYFRGKQNSKRFSRYHSSNNYRNHSKDNSYSSRNNLFNNSNYKKYEKRNVDICEYYHPSMTEDPWAELEREMDPDSQDSSDPNSDHFGRFEVDTNNLGDDTTDSQDDSQVSTEESS